MADEGDVKSEIKLAFAALDQDGDQTLSKQEIAELIRNLSNQTPSQVQIQRLFDWFETPITGKIPLEKLVKKIGEWVGDSPKGSKSPGSPRVLRKREAVQGSIRKFFVDFLSGSMSCFNRDPVKMQERLKDLGNDVETSLGSIRNYHSMNEEASRPTAEMKLKYASDCYSFFQSSNNLKTVLAPLKDSSDPPVIIKSLKGINKMLEIKKALRSPEERYEVNMIVFQIFHSIFTSNVVPLLKSYLRPDWIGLLEDLNPADRAQKLEVQYYVLAILSDFVGGPNYAHMTMNEVFHPSKSACFRHLMSALEDRTLLPTVFRLIESSPNYSVRGAASRLIGSVAEQGYDTAQLTLIALDEYLKASGFTESDIVSKLLPLLTGLNDLQTVYMAKIAPQIELVRQRRLAPDRIQLPNVTKEWIVMIRAQTWALAHMCVSLTSGENGQQMLKELIPRALCKGNTKMLQLLLFVLQQLNIRQMVPWVVDAYMIVNCINVLACFAPASEIFWGVPRMKEDLLTLLVFAMARSWTTARQCNMVNEACLWCFEKILLSTNPQSPQAKVFSQVLLKNTGYVRQLVNLMSTLEENEESGLTQAMVTSLQRGALVNFKLLLRIPVALEMLGGSSDFVKALMNVLLDHDASSAQHAAVAAHMFLDLSSKGSDNVRRHLLKCGVANAIFRALENFRQTDKLLAKTYGVAYGTKYNVPLALSIFKMIRTLLIRGTSASSETLRYIGADQIQALNRFMDVVVLAVGENQLAKWNTLADKEDSKEVPFEKKALGLYLDVLKIHETSSDPTSRQILQEGRPRYQQYVLKMTDANSRRTMVKQRREILDKSSNAGIKLVTDEKGQKMFLLDLEWGVARSSQVKIPITASLVQLMTEIQKTTSGYVQLSYFAQRGWAAIMDESIWQQVKQSAMGGRRIRLRADFRTSAAGMMGAGMGAAGMGMGMGAGMGMGMGAGMGAGMGMGMGAGMGMGMGGNQSWVVQRSQSVGEMATTLARHNIRLDPAQLSMMRMTLRQMTPTGRIDIRQRDTVFKSCLMKAGIPVNRHPKLVQALWKQFDFDRNNYIDESEFVVGLSLLTRGTPQQKLELIFDAFDRNKDGTLDGRELAELFQAMTNQPFANCQRLTNMMLGARRFMNKEMFVKFMQFSAVNEANRWWHQMRMMTGSLNQYNTMGGVVPLGTTMMGLSNPVASVGVPIGGGMMGAGMGMGMGMGMGGGAMMGGGMMMGGGVAPVGMMGPGAVVMDRAW